MSIDRGKQVLKSLEDGSTQNIVLVSNEVEFTGVDNSKLSEHGDIEISGWFITEKLIEDRGLIVEADAFAQSNSMDLFNGRVLAFHNDFKEPVGEVISKEIVKGKGVRGRVLIYKENSELFKRSILEGTLAAFSVGFKIEEFSFNEKTEILTVKKALLKEVSVVNIGADSDATFEVEASMDDKTTKTHTLERSITLSDTKKNEFNAEQFMAEQKSLGQNVTELSNTLTAIKDWQDQANKNLITKGELAERLEKVSTDLNVIQTQIEEQKNRASFDSIKLAHTDYRSLLQNFSWLTDDNGNQLGELHQKAHCLFQMPVDYDAMQNGHALKNLRDLHDAVVITDAMKRSRGRDRYNIMNLKLYTQLVKATEAFDKDVALAMAGGNSGFGSEWVPSELSSEFNEILRIQPTLANRFQTWMMPKGGSAKFPFQNGKAVVYKGGEALVDNAAEARKTNVATGAKTFTPELFIGALVSSEELTEDAVLEMVGFIRAELATALNEGKDSAIINGDDSGTHFDNASGTLPYAAYNVETGFKGLRKLSISNARDIEISSATTGVNALELVNFTDAKQDMGVAGINPADCVFATGIKGRTQVQQALFKTDALGVLAFMISGSLPTIDGSEVYVSAQWDELLASDGTRDSTADEKHTSMVCVHKPSFRIGQRRGITVEFNKNILTQQQQFVATARWDFGKVSADSIEPVAGMINIQHTT